MSEEHEELVTDFASLRARMLVVVKRPGCGCAKHRGMIIGRYDGETACGWIGPSWSIVPRAHGDHDLPHTNGELVVSSRAVAEGRVYRIVEANPQAETAEAAEVRPKKRERAGVR